MGLPLRIGRLEQGQSGGGESSETPPLAERLSPLRGRWAGAISTYQGDRPLEINVQEDGDIHVRMAGQLATLLNDVQYSDGELLGAFAGDVGTDDANRRPYHVALRLKLRGDLLNGSATAISLPGKRPGNALSYWIELRRDQAR